MTVEKSKEEAMIDYIKALAAIEEEMEPFAESKRELKKNCIENGWLTRDELSLTVKAYRMLKNGEDMEKLLQMYGTLAGEV